MKAARFIESWRRQKSRAFDLEHNSTAGRTISVDFWGRSIQVYANVNLSIYSGEACNARCPFCVEELRPASRGSSLELQKRVEGDDRRYFSRLEDVLAAVRPVRPSVSITGGEPSKDPRLPIILRILEREACRKRTITTNGSGLLDLREGRRIIDWIGATGVKHLNISRAHPDDERNAELMRASELPAGVDLREVVRRARATRTRVRLSCVLLRDAVHTLEDIVTYLEYAKRLGVDNVIFRRLMKTDSRTVASNQVVRYSNRQRVRLEPLLDRISEDGRFQFERQVMGYYYYVEVWKYGDMDVVFEEADLAQLERTKKTMPGVVHELIFHPNARLASTWQPWGGVLGPPTSEMGEASFLDCATDVDRSTVRAILAQTV